MSRIVNPPTVVVQSDAELLAKATAARLVTRLVDAQAMRGTASLVLTGGGIGIAVLEQLALAPARDAIDWSRVDIWWGDERFLPSGDPDRNETQARRALLDHGPVPAERVDPMGASDRVDDSPEAAARRYADELREAAERAHFEERGWVESAWGLSENNRRAKFYDLTAAGRRQLTLKANDFATYAGAVFKILGAGK